MIRGFGQPAEESELDFRGGTLCLFLLWGAKSCFYTLENISTGTANWAIGKNVALSRQMATNSGLLGKSTLRGNTGMAFAVLNRQFTQAMANQPVVLIQWVFEKLGNRVMVSEASVHDKHPVAKAGSRDKETGVLARDLKPFRTVFVFS